MKEAPHTLLHFPVLSKADCVFFRFFGPGLGNLLFPLYRAYQAQQTEGGTLVFPQFTQLKPGPWLRGEPDSRAYSDLFRPRSASEVWNHVQALALSRSTRKNKVKTYEGLGRHFLDLDPMQRNGFRELLIQRYRSPSELRETLDSISSNDICIHIRRGDFLSPDAALAQQGLMNVQLSDKWYIDATSMIRHQNPLGKVRVFTDAVSLPAGLVRDLKADEIDRSPNALHSMLKMAAHGTIIASKSSFSLWAAYLGSCHTIIPDSFDLKRYMPANVLNVVRC